MTISNTSGHKQVHVKSNNEADSGVNKRETNTDLTPDSFTEMAPSAGSSEATTEVTTGASKSVALSYKAWLEPAGVVTSTVPLEKVVVHNSWKCGCVWEQYMTDVA